MPPHAWAMVGFELCNCTSKQTNNNHLKRINKNMGTIYPTQFPTLEWQTLSYIENLFITKLAASNFYSA
jgi:hypothetical protein